jgi:hypothetical protein
LKQQAEQMCRGQAIEAEDVNPVTAHLLNWFNDINSDRTFTIIAGMGGGASIPNAISYQDLAAWASMTGHKPARWEIEALRAMDAAWRAAYQPSGGTGKNPVAEKQHQAVGEYCNGKHLEECSKQFGNNLERACSTCPN